MSEEMQTGTGEGQGSTFAGGQPGQGGAGQQSVQLLQSGEQLGVGIGSLGSGRRLRGRLSSSLGSPPRGPRSARSLVGERTSGTPCLQHGSSALVTSRRSRIVHCAAAGARDQGQRRTTGIAVFRVRRVDALAQRTRGGPHRRVCSRATDHRFPCYGKSERRRSPAAGAKASGHTL